MQNPKDILKETFGIFMIESAYTSEEQYILAVNDCNSIDWTKISSNPELPEYIMENFPNLLSWQKIILNRPMSIKTINKFRKYLMLATKYDRFIKDAEKISKSALLVILEVNDGLASSIFKKAYENNYHEIVKTLYTHPKITKDAIIEAWQSAYVHNYLEIIKILHNDLRISREYISQAFKNAAIDDYVETIEFLINNPKITEYDIVDAYENLMLYRNGEDYHSAKILESDPRFLSIEAWEYAAETCKISSIQKLQNDPRFADRITKLWKLEYENNCVEFIQILHRNQFIKKEDIVAAWNHAYMYEKDKGLDIIHILVFHPMISDENILDALNYHKHDKSSKIYGFLQNHPACDEFILTSSAAQTTS